MRVAVLWKGSSGYIDSLLRELSYTNEVLAITTQLDPNAPFALEDGNWPFWEPLVDYQSLISRVKRWQPDVILCCSWDVASYRRLARRLRGAAVRVVYMDNQWRGTAKQWLGIVTSPIYLWPTFDVALVTGSRQARFAAKLGYGKARTALGGCSADTSAFVGPTARTGFVFVGRLAAEKGIADLVRSYQAYRLKTEAPWPLLICGAGPLRSELEASEGIVYLGFVQPALLPSVIRSAACIVLPSLFEPWGVVVHEAVSCGLHVIASRAVGAADDLVRDGVNGRIFESGDSGALVDSLVWIHHRTDEEVAAGSLLSQQLASQFSPQRWVEELSALVAGRASRIVGIGDNR